MMPLRFEKDVGSLQAVVFMHLKLKSTCMYFSRDRYTEYVNVSTSDFDIVNTVLFSHFWLFVYTVVMVTCI